MMRLLRLDWRLYSVIGVLAVGVLAWMGAAAFIWFDSITVSPTPTIIVRTIAAMEASPTYPATQSASSTATSVLPTPTIDAIDVAISPSSSPPPIIATVTVEVGPTSLNGCTPPDGWTQYDVQPGDTLFGFAVTSAGQTSVDAIMAGNCLKSKTLSIGQVLFLPPDTARQALHPARAGGSGVAGSPDRVTRTANCPCTITVQVGWRLEQIAAAIDKLPVGFSGADFLAGTGSSASVSPRSFLSTRPPGKSLEGFMFPGEYTVQNSTTAAQFRDMLLDSFGAHVSAQVQADAGAQGMTFWQAVALASIVQRESRTSSEQKLIASVFHNRIAAGKGLASSVTLQYALGRPGNWWPRIVGNLVNTKSAYNTNLNVGLPPSPIDSPGLDAILAAVYPANTDYQYFSAKCGGGGNFYASTFEEFKQGLQCP